MADIDMHIPMHEYPVSLSPAQPKSKKKMKHGSAATLRQSTQNPAAIKFSYALGRYVGQIKVAQQKR